MALATALALPRKLAGGLAFGARFTAGQIQALVARVTFAAVEGVAFAFGRRGVTTVVAAELVVLSYHAGPGRAVRIATCAFSALALGRALWVLLHVSRTPLPRLPSSASIWDWKPEGDGYASSTWHVLRALVRTANTVREENPALDKLLSQPSLSPTEFGMRLYYLYALHRQQPVWDQFGKAADSPGAACGERASLLGRGSEDGEEEEGEAEWEEVPRELMQKLEYYRPFACFLYYYSTDQELSKALEEQGYTLCMATYDADITTGAPAYYLSINEGRREVLVTVRGTWSPEDVFVDLMATGEPFEGTEFYCHSGMFKGALALLARLGALVAAAEAQGYQVTLVGHSLGAGVAAILACSLKDKGLYKLKCYAFETPACMDKGLAASCADVVVSTVIGDDIVPRLSPELFARLLDELANFDWRAEAEEHQLLPANAVVQHLSMLFSGKKEKSSGAAVEAEGKGSSSGGREPKGASSSGSTAGSSAGTGGALHGAAEAVRGAAAAAAEEGPSKLGQELEKLTSLDFEAATYNPYIPGRIVFLYRRPMAPGEAATAPNAGSSSASSSSSSAGARDSRAATASAAAGEKGAGAGAGSTEAGAAAAAAAAEAEPGVGIGRVLLPPWHPVLRKIRVTEHMLADHFIDTPFAMRALAAPGDTGVSRGAPGMLGMLMAAL